MLKNTLFLFVEKRLLKSCFLGSYTPSLQSIRQRSSSRRRLTKLGLGAASGWVISSFFAQAYAADLAIGSSGIQFDRDTTLETNFVESHGAYQSTFGVINLDTNEKTPLLREVKSADNPASIYRPSTRTNDVATPQDFIGTPGSAVSQTTSRYTFRANTNYVFYLESTFNDRPVGTVYSTDVLNANRERQAVFTGNPTDICASGGVVAAWDDTGSKIVKSRGQQDRDFDDFIVRMRDTACPIGEGVLPPPIPEDGIPPVVTGQLPPGGGAAPPGGGAVPPSGGGIPPAVGGGAPPFPIIPVGLGLLGAGGLAVAVSGGGDDNDNGSTLSITPPTQPMSPSASGGEPIPEPLTILGSGTAIGFVTLLQRKRSKKRQKP